MSETELREALLNTILAGVEHNGIPHPRHSDACHLADAKIVRAAFASFDALASIPAEPEQADEVAGLDAIVLAQVLAFLGGSPGFSPAFVTDAQTELALRIAAAYPLAVEYRARLAPARDDTSGGAS